MFVFQVREKPGEVVQNALGNLNQKLNKDLADSLSRQVPGFKNLTPFQQDVAASYVLASMAAGGMRKAAQMAGCDNKVIANIDSVMLPKLQALDRVKFK